MNITTKLILFTVLALFALPLFSQSKCSNYITDYYPDMYAAYYAYRVEEDNDKALDLLDKLWNKCRLLRTSPYNEIDLYLDLAMQKKDYNKAAIVCKALIENYAYKWHNVPLKEDGTKLLDSSTYLFSRNQFIAQKDTSLSTMLKFILEEDQKCRTLFGKAFYGKSKSEFKRMYYGMLMERTDAVNDSITRVIFKKWGYPSYAQSGDDVSYSLGSLEILLLHMSYEHYYFYISILLKYIKEGKCSPHCLASIVDRKMTEEHQFTYLIFNKTYDRNGKLIDITEDMIRDPANLNKRRIAIGLPPIEMERAMKPKWKY